jgi:hypothetical protein
MNKKIAPDLGYLAAKGVEEASDLRALFDKLTIKMNKVNDTNLKQDLLPLFVNRTYIENWLKNWRESYLRLVDAYKISTVTTLESVQIHQDFNPGNFYFTYTYLTEEGGQVRLKYVISDDWLKYREGDLSIQPDEIHDNLLKMTREGASSQSLPEGKLRQYAALFYQKTEKYLKKVNRNLLGRSIDTKLIRMTADNLNQKEQIVLNKSALLSCELDDLLK